MTFPFFVGCGRSGTTLVRAMLDSHSSIAIPFESHFIVELARKRQDYETVGGFSVDTFVADLVQQWGFTHWQLSAEGLRAHLLAEPVDDFPDAIRKTFALYAIEHGKSRYGDKTPLYVMYLPFLATLFPESKFIHIVRDGRDVALALADVEWFWPNDLPTAALYWAGSVDTGRRAGRWLGSRRYYELRYEQLIESPSESLRALCAFIDLEFEDGMLQYFEAATQVINSLPDPEEHTHLALPPTTGLRDWRSEMSARDLATFESLAGEVLVSLGYPLSGVAQ